MLLFVELALLILHVLVTKKPSLIFVQICKGVKHFIPHSSPKEMHMFFLFLSTLMGPLGTKHCLTDSGCFQPDVSSWKGSPGSWLPPACLLPACLPGYFVRS